ncbi:MAG: NAD(+) diphosphatase [Marinobacter sp.]|uniref:NAD(+) diphosphatase n=1 Tax=Marinobacter sp. TaxID=50741 RepID=UPI0034A0AEBD
MVEWVAGWSREAPEPDAGVVAICDGFILRAESGWLHAWSDARDHLAEGMEPIFVGRLGIRPVYVAEVTNASQISGLESVHLRDVFLTADDATATMVGTAAQVAQWWRDHRFCGRCGQATDYHPNERARWCTSCKIPWYARVAPCVIVVIRQEGRMLLAQSVRARKHFYSLIAGFVEAGESAEEAVAREVLEETGLQVTNIRYCRSQPWPFPHQLMLGFFADYVGGQLVLQQDELVHADWFRPGELPPVPPDATIAGRLIRAMEEEIRADELRAQESGG